MGSHTAPPLTEDVRATGRRWPRRVAWGLFVVVVVAMLILVLFTRFSVRRAFPQTEGAIRIEGLSSGVEVIRDSMGVPHIYADTVEDLFLAQGFVHAQDRFFQMDFWRHISSGRLAEMFGSSQVETDTFLRTLGWGALAERQYTAETDEVRSILDAYALGVNAYIAQRSPAELGFEYTIIDVLNRGYDPEPWTAPQSLAWGKVMSWDLGGNMENEIERAMALGSMPAERVAQLFPPYPGDRHPFIIPDATGSATAREAVLSIPDGALPGLEAALGAVRTLQEVTGGGSDTGIGSNSWAVSGLHTPTGAPFLANDPHLANQMPSIWYQVGLHCREVGPECPFDVAGFGFPGVPGVVIGHNAHIAWGVTNTGPDVQDLYIEKINPDDPMQYEYRGEWLDMDVRTETISVGGGDSVEVTVRSTIHGPIISDSYGPLEDFGVSGVERPDPYAIALRWTGLDDVPSIAGPILGINVASNFEEFRDAARSFNVPAQNLLYADTEGNIGYQMPGDVPIRTSGDGTYPVPGWTGDHEWSGFIPFEDLPWSYNPDSGWIVTANNAVIDDSYGYLITQDWSRGYRARRIVDLVTSNLGIPLDAHRIIQYDSYDLSASYLRPFVVAAVDSSTSALDDTAVEVLEALVSWDLQNFAGSTGAAIWNATWRHILRLTFHDEVSEDFRPAGGERWFEVVRNLVDDPNDPFWDDVTTGEAETRDMILAAAFEAAVDELASTLGHDVGTWDWGSIHTISFRNQTLGDSGIGLIEDRFNRGPYPASGSKSVPNAVGWDAAEGYEVDWHPSLRMLVDLGDFSNSVAIHATGQSGHTDHPHYDDMIPLWLAGETVPFLWERSDIDADASAVLNLTP
ncbi:MAG TPA: penicillin acylase family protein [Acidimicrobiia bacterium]|nr:penicillin acylase family protein [Acidimicrobiia bacterium]